MAFWNGMHMRCLHHPTFMIGPDQSSMFAGNVNAGYSEIFTVQHSDGVAHG